MASDRITLDVGGRLFHTTRGTLEFSQAGYFEALLRRWGSASDDRTPSKKRRRMGPSEEEAQSKMSPFVVEGARLPPSHPISRDTSCSSDADLRPTTEPLFIDRDPDAFEDVLYFMRTHQIKPTTRVDACKAKQLQIESLFYGYDLLTQACQECLSQLATIHRPPLPEPTPEVYSDTVVLGRRGNLNRPRKEMLIPRGQVLYIDFASLYGLEAPHIANLPDNQRISLGFYRRPNERLVPGQRRTLNATIICSGTKERWLQSSSNSQYHQKIGVCVSPKGPCNKMGIACSAPIIPGLLWQVHYWVGPADRIPGLKCGGGASVNPVAPRPDPLS